ncbi:MAG: arabinan endo,5-alpha-L-arabinosidase, partial [Frankiaceae bacterium]|nr:arabinan endo,5-alpha-L-arabinosidase [Frankiaceae bacterium]
PVINANFPDPDILLVDGVYHAYATNSGGQNIQHQTSRDLLHWTPRPDALPVLGAWVGPCSFAPGGATDHCIWAPEVSAVAGHYVMYYTARDKLAPRQCIGAATSLSPDGPFVPVGTEPLVCPDGARGTTDLGGAIDASTYKENGQLYLLWKADGNCCPGKAAIIFIQPLSADGLTLTGPPTELLRVTQHFEGNVVEAPTLLKHNGTYYLFYSANDFGGGNYRTNYATATSITGPYTKSLRELMTTDLFHGTVIGPGGQDVFTNKRGTTSIVFHGWDPTYTYRAMYTSELVWSATGVPTVKAADTRYQAEDGVVVDARVVPDNTASGEAKVGGMDNLDSSVTLRMYAPKSGPAILGIRYANGSLDANGNGVPATDTVTVNGKSAGVVTLANTAWGNWTMTPYGVTLNKGWNTVTLTKLTYYAEIDAVDLYYGPAPKVSHEPMGDPATATRYEAEAGVITHANVVPDARASAGAKVGGLDFLDSSVTLTINVATAGVKTLRIRFDNGSLDRSGYPVVATDTVTVNGVPARSVTFPNTTWGNWETVDYRVLLHAGANTVTFTKATFYTELDAVDVF